MMRPGRRTTTLGVENELALRCPLPHLLGEKGSDEPARPQLNRQTSSAEAN